jgi:hypothetical protein
MITQWNDSEDDALQGLPLRAQIIYLRGIRRYMNYKTGVSGGPERRISLKMLGEIAESYHNRKRDQPNKKEVIVSIDQLKKAGLIERIEDKDYLIFFLPKADLDKSVQNNHGTTTAQPRHNHGTDHGTGNPSNDGACRDNHGIGEKCQEFDTTLTTAHISSQISDINTTVLNARDGVVPKDASEWIEFFVNEKGFQFHEAQTAKTVPMYVNWVKQKISIADMELAMMDAHNWLGGKKADNPTVYRKFVETVVFEKQKSLGTASNRHQGLPNNQMKGGNNYERKPKISPEAWRDTNF